MIVVRTVMQAQFGKGGELAAEFSRATSEMMSEMGVTRRWRVLTDLSGPYDMMVQEIEAESLAEWEQMRTRLFQLRSFHEAMDRIQGMIASGRNELWTIEAES